MWIDSLMICIPELFFIYALDQVLEFPILYSSVFNVKIKLYGLKSVYHHCHILKEITQLNVTSRLKRRPL